MDDAGKGNKAFVIDKAHSYRQATRQTPRAISQAEEAATANVNPFRSLLVGRRRS